MLNINEVIETNKMIHEMNLDVRTITMGISLLDCVSESLDEVCENIYKKITTKAKNLVKVGKERSGRLCPHCKRVRPLCEGSRCELYRWLFCISK